MKVLLVGFGDLALRLAPKLLARGHSVRGLKRSESQVEGVKMVLGSCLDSDLLSQAVQGCDVIIASLTPDEYSEDGYRKAYPAPAACLAKALSSQENHSRVIWVSSTRVYGQHNGHWVDEESPVKPHDYAGRLLLEAENTILNELRLSSIVRFSGIYGRGEGRLIKKILAGERVSSAPPLWSNRIHIDDCVGILDFLVEKLVKGEKLSSLYLASDCEPVTQYELQSWLALKLGVKPTREVAAASMTNRRCRNTRLLESGYTFQFPTYREGYGETLRLLNLGGQ